MDLNQVTLVGRLADNVRFEPGTDKKTARAMGRLMINRRPGQDGKKAVDAIQITAWGKHAENLATWTKKGKELGVKGEIRTNSVAPKTKGGAWQNYYEVMVTELSFGRDSTAAKAMLALENSAGTLAAAASQVGSGAASVQQYLEQNPEAVQAITKAAQGKSPETEETQEEETPIEDPFAVV